jgi:hypothetical protein
MTLSYDISLLKVHPYMMYTVAPNILIKRHLFMSIGLMRADNREIDLYLF